jgi:glutamate-1-semialdehyde 2,1-aminomutase
MALVAPLGPVYQAGTFSGNATAMAAGLAQLGEVAKPGFYESLAGRTQALADGLAERARKYGLTVSVNRAGAMFTLFFRPTPPENFDEVAQSDATRYRRYFHGMLEQGIFMPPSQFETVFLSAAHTSQDIDKTLEAADHVFRNL